MVENGNIIEVRNLTKRYPGVVALDNVDLTVKKGETHILVGENGAGKTTLIKILCGATLPDECGKLYFDGKPAVINSPRDVIPLGIAAIQQNFSLVEDMTVADNIFLGREMSDRFGQIDYERTKADTRRLLNEMGVDINPAWRVSRLDMSHKQIVEICKALSQQPKLLIMDEPTSGLTSDEIKRLFEVIARLKSHGITILYISHRLEEAFEVGDRVTVLRNGKKVLEEELSKLNHAELTRHIVGYELLRRYPKETVEIEDVRLSVQGLENTNTRPTLKGVTFDVRAGEVLAICGILGCGKDELADTLFGRTPATGGTIRIDGKEVQIDQPRRAIQLGIGYLTAERHKDGLVELMSLRANLSLSSLERQFSRFGSLQLDKERNYAERYIKELQLHAPHTEIPVQKLSGGNQQKIVFGKWLLTEPRILILNEPTKGIDVGSKVSMFELMMQEVKKGMALILLTNELDEAIEMGDRIFVMRGGSIEAEISRKQILDGTVTRDEVLRLATKQDRGIPSHKKIISKKADKT